ncbi:AAA family ATPase [Viscerimonas tarda]
MKVSFENLGIIKNITLDLSKKLLVFCGPNGTGKTYACYAVYEYVRHLLNMKAISGEDIFDMPALLDKKEIVVALDYDKLFSLKESYIGSIDINEAFGLQGNTHFVDFKAGFLESKDEFIQQIKSWTFSLEIDKIHFEKKSDSDSLTVTLLDNVELLLSDGYFYNSIIAKYICFYSLLRVYILPVERNSVYTFASELARNKFTTNKEEKNRYPRPIQDALAIAVDLNFVKKNESKYRWLAEEIETTILHGDVIVSEDGELQFAPESSPGVSLPIHLSASIIKNLSGLLIYLKHQAKENELLIIDEPELGLHPDNQILLARIFARLINNGIRLLISTHSDYIIRELNNLIMLSADNDDIKQNAEKWGYKEDEKINPDNVGAYLFKLDKNSQVVVESLPVDDNGFEVVSIDKAISQLNERSEDIFYSLRYGEADR